MSHKNSIDTFPPYLRSILILSPIYVYKLKVELAVNKFSLVLQNIHVILVRRTAARNLSSYAQN